jgi:hypothetical protein
MKRTVSILSSLCLAMVLSVAVIGQASAKDKAAKGDKTAKTASSDKEARVSGTVQMVSKDTSTITVRDKNNVQRPVVYSGDTKFTYRNQPGSIDDVKDGRRVIVLGKFDDKTRLQASRVDVRSGK